MNSFFLRFELDDVGRRGGGLKYSFIIWRRLIAPAESSEARISDAKFLAFCQSVQQRAVSSLGQVQLLAGFYGRNQRVKTKPDVKIKCRANKQTKESNGFARILKTNQKINDFFAYREEAGG